MITFLFATLTYLRAFLVSRHNLGLEAAALRQQLTVYKRKQPTRSCTDSIDCSGLRCGGYGRIGPMP
jgi:hypothetical protein